MKPTKTELDILEEKRNQRIAALDEAIRLRRTYNLPFNKQWNERKQLVGKFPTWQKLLE